MTVSEPGSNRGMLTSTGEDKYFYERTADNGTLTWQPTFTEQQDVYIYFEASHCEKPKVTIDGERRLILLINGDILFILTV